MELKQLHSSYGNLQSWETRVDREARIARIVFAKGRAAWTAFTIFLICTAIAIWAGFFFEAANASKIAISVALVGAIVPGGILLWILAEMKRGDLLIYHAGEDRLTLPRMGKEIEKAKSRVSFSSEHYMNLDSHFFELNLVLDGERLPFISSSVANGFSTVVKGVERMGFSVSTSKIRIK